MSVYNISNKHIACQYSGQTLTWCATDSLTAFQDNIKTQKDKLEQLGWLDPEVISYKFNSNGFREEEFDDRVSGIALGCSLTSGIGLPLNTVWPSVLSKKLNTKIWNLGVGGAALDTCYRLLDYWIKRLNVKFVICAVPIKTRFEVFINDNWECVLPQNLRGNDWLSMYSKNYITYSENSELNQHKNLLAMQEICNQHQVLFYYDLMQYQLPHAKEARDLMHPGVNSQAWIADKLFENTKEILS